MKGSIKANTVDKYLLPVRKQVIKLIKPNADVIEFGCGNGDLLFKLSNKIKYGLGVDNSESLISYARKYKETKKYSNLDFKVEDLRKEFSFHKNFNFSIASLLFHVLPWHNSINLLTKMIEISDFVIICGFTKPKNWKQNFLLWLDQRFSGHYVNFTKYKENNYMEGLLKAVGIMNYSSYSSFDPVIKIYKITKRNNV